MSEKIPYYTYIDIETYNVSCDCHPSDLNDPDAIREIEHKCRVSFEWDTDGKLIEIYINL